MTRRLTGSTLAACIAVSLGACAHAPAAPADTALRVMTYNIAAGHGNLALTAATIRASAPDLVALQEVDVHWDARSGFADQATALGESLGMQVRFAPIYRVPSPDASAPPREYGVALLSRHPIVAFTNHPLTRLSTQPGSTAPALMPGLLDATIEARGTRIRVLNTHLDYRPDPSVRQRQVTEMLAIIGEPETPTILFGDLNAPPTAPELQPLFARLRDTWPAPGEEGFTYPAAAPTKRIDYVLVSSHLRATSVSVPVTLASDHRPVVVDLVVERTRR